MTEKTALLTQEQVVHVHSVLLGNWHGINLNEMRRHLQSMQSEIAGMIKQSPNTYPVLQDFIVDLETAEEAIEDAIQGVNTLVETAKANTARCLTIHIERELES